MSVERRVPISVQNLRVPFDRRVWLECQAFVPAGYGESPWRSFFRSTIAHNTAELGGPSQSIEGGPFMSARHAHAREVSARHAHAREVEVTADGDIATWTAEQERYASLDPPALHRRPSLLDQASRIIDVIDQIEGGSYDIRLAFHLGPEVQLLLNECCTVLSWPVASASVAARLELSPGLRWTLHQGETDPIPGWYAPGLGRRVPAFSLLGSGRSAPGTPLATRLEFLAVGTSPRALVSREAIPWSA